MKYDAERTYLNQDFQNLHIIQGLDHVGNTPLQWAGEVPTDALIELRKTGTINKIRSILAKSIDDFVSADNLDFKETSHLIFNNLNAVLFNTRRTSKN